MSAPTRTNLLIHAKQRVRMGLTCACSLYELEIKDQIEDQPFLNRFKLRQLCQPPDHFPQFYDLQVCRAGAPGVTPADDDVALKRIMAMGAKLSALIFKLNAHVLPAAGFHL